MIKKLLVPSFVLSAVVLFCSFTNNLVSAAATSTVSDQSGFPVIDVNELPPPSGNPPGTEALDNIATTTKFTTPKASPIYISNFELDKDVYNSGDNVSGTITLFNSQGVDQLDVYINVSLAGQYSKEPGQYNIPQVVYDTKSFGPFTVKTNTFTKIPLPYTLPTAVGGKNLGVNVQTRMVSGLPIGGSKTVFLKEVIGGLKLLSIKEAYTTIGDGKKYSPQLGHVLNATSSDSFHVVLTNSSTETITVTPNVEIHNLISSNPTIKKYTTDQIAIAPKGTYEFITSPYKEGLSSGVYVAGITFLDDKNISRAPPVEFRYILPGDVAVIQGLQFDNKSVKKDEVIHANVIFGGVNYDPTTGAQNPIANATLNLKVYDGNSDQVIGYGSSTLNFDKGAGSVLLPITINKDASTIRVESTIEKDGKTIAANTSSVTTPTDTEVQNRSDGYFWWLLLVVLSAISFVFVLLTIVSRRSTNKVTLGLFFLAIIASTGFIAKNAESEAYLWWNTTTSYAYLDYTTFSQPNTKPWLTLGDPVYVNGVVTNWTAVGAGQLINVYANLSNASYTPVTAQQVWSTGSRYSWGTNWDAFGFKFTGPSKVGAYYADVRVYDWQPFYGYESDQRYRVPFYVYNPVNVTCSADKTVVKIGETVNWTMTTSGGTGSYRYYWYNPTDQTNYTNSPQVTTLSKTYTTKGTKNMFAAIVDNYTKNNSNSNNGGWKQCSNTVTVTDPITVSCAADKATPNVGEVVNWNATASGGTGQYTYVWQDPENFSAVSATSSTLTKTYSSIGTKSVSVMVYDKAITGIVPTSQGVNAVCSTTVSLTCTSPQVLNGAGTACVTPLTCTAPQIMNPAGTACVTPLTCTAPQVLNADNSACICTNGSTGASCTLPVTVIPAPTVTGPTSGLINTDYTYSAVSRLPTLTSRKTPQTASVSNALLAQTATTPQLKYGFDWNKDGTVDEWQPTTGFTDIGITVNSIHSWNTVGLQPFQVKAVDDGGISSLWTQYSINITNPVVAPVATSSIRVVHFDSTLGWPSTVPAGFYAKLDSQEATMRTGNPHDYTNLVGGSSHIVYVADLPGFTQSVATCQYLQGASECNIDSGSFSAAGITCNGAICSIPVSTTDGKTTKVGIKYVSNGNTCEFGGTFPACNCSSGNQPVNGSCALTCTLPQVLNTAGTACTTPLTCTAPQVLNTTGSSCVCTNGGTGASCTVALTCTSPQILDGTGTSCVCENGATTADCQIPSSCTPPQIIDASGTECVCENGGSGSDCTLPQNVADCSTDVGLCGSPGGGSSCSLPDGTVLQDGYSRRYYKPGSCTTDYVDFTCKNGSATPGTVATYTSSICNGVASPIVIPPKNPPVIVTFLARPNIVNAGQSCALTTSALKSRFCTVTASPSSSGWPYKLVSRSTGSLDKTINSSQLTGTTRFTLTCTGREKNSVGEYPTVTKTATCSLNPSRTDF